MKDINSQNYFDRLLEKAAARSLITTDQQNRLSASWHNREKNTSIAGLYYLTLALSIFGIFLGVVVGIPQTLRSESFHSLLRWLAQAADYLYNDFLHFFTLLPVKAACFFVAGIALNYVGDWLDNAAKQRPRYLARPAYLAGTVLHAVAMGYVVVQGIVFDGWEELEVTSIGFWSIIPLIMAVFGGGRPLFYQILTGAIIAAHSLAFNRGISGNSMIAFDVSIAVILISAAQFLEEKNVRLALCIRYLSMTIICFLLYCTGFVWDLPAILQFWGYIKPGAHHPTALFLIALFSLAVTAMAVAYFHRPGRRSRADKQFTLLLLCTLLFAYFATGILMQYISVGVIFDLFGGQFKQSIFTSNAILALLLSWLIWFLWCLWLLVESRETGKIILAQLGVTAMLGSIEIRYVEICRNFSFATGLVMLPIALVLAAVSVKFLGRWLRELLPGGIDADPVKAVQPEETDDGVSP